MNKLGWSCLLLQNEVRTDKLETVTGLVCHFLAQSSLLDSYYSNLTLLVAQSPSYHIFC